MTTCDHRPCIHVSPRLLLALLALLAASDPARAEPSLYVSENNGTIQSFTSAGVGSTFATVSGDQLRGLAFDASGNLYAADDITNSILKFTPGGVSTVFATGLDTPEGLAFDSSGNLYVANFGNSETITKITPSGVASTFASGISANALAFDASGNLYAGDTFTNTIKKYTPSGVGTVFASTGVNDPTGLAFDASGNLFVANGGNNTIEKFTPSGVGTTFATMGLNFPRGLAFDASGNLYAANYFYASGSGITIEEFTPGGVGTVFATTSSSPAFLAFSPAAVPEPSSLVLVIVGAAGPLTYLARRRRPAGSSPGRTNAGRNPGDS